jgi:hypothetical protein
MAISSINVLRLVLQETGTYNIQYYRPYLINTTPASTEKLLRKVESTVQQNGKVSSASLSGMGEELIAPQAAPQAPVAIPGGWTDKRIRFVLEVLITNSFGAQSIYYVQGYTNYFGISPSGHIDPNMLFIINSVFQLSRRAVSTPTGQIYQDRIIDCSHLLVSPQYLDPTSQLSLYTLQPVDLFSYIQASAYDAGYNALDQYDQIGSNEIKSKIMIDTRLMTSANTFKSSQRRNSAPLDYLSQTLNYGIQSQIANDTNEGYIAPYHDTVSIARGFAESDESKLKNSDFISLLNNDNFTNAQQITSVFTLGQLMKFDPNTPAVTNYLKLDPNQRAQLHQSGLTSNWNGSDKTTQVAVILANSVPTIMSQCLISRIHFRSTNLMLAGQFTTQIIDAKSLSNTVLTSMFELFKERIEREIIYDFTYGNMIGYTLDVRCDMFGETTIKISLDNEPEVIYVVPSFCDSLITPVSNVDPSRVVKEASSINYLIDAVYSTVSQYSSHSGVKLNYSI